MKHRLSKGRCFFMTGYVWGKKKPANAGFLTNCMKGLFGLLGFSGSC